MGRQGLPTVAPGKLQQVIGGADAAMDGRLVRLEFAGQRRTISRKD